MMPPPPTTTRINSQQLGENIIISSGENVPYCFKKDFVIEKRFFKNQGQKFEIF